MQPSEGSITKLLTWRSAAYNRNEAKPRGCWKSVAAHYWQLPLSLTGQVETRCDNCACFRSLVKSRHSRSRAAYFDFNSTVLTKLHHALRYLHHATGPSPDDQLLRSCIKHCGDVTREKNVALRSPPVILNASVRIKDQVRHELPSPNSHPSKRVSIDSEFHHHCQGEAQWATDPGGSTGAAGSACLFRLSKESPPNPAHDARKRKTKKYTYGCEEAMGLVAKFARPVCGTLRDNSRDCRKYQGYRQYQ